jgi:ribonuclease BN (tRNA processing enzyme)
MRIQVLGCSGGIGGPARTTALRVDDDILIDAGTGVADLDLAAMAAIHHVFLTHSHLDHIACLPLLLDSTAGRRDRPLTVHAQPLTVEALCRHVFNGQIWPDFTRLPSPEQPFVRFEALTPGVERVLDGRRFRSIAVNHSVPAVGYLVGNGRASLAFSGDTAETEPFWRALNACPDLRYVVIETSFTDAEEELARVSGHLHPRRLASELAKLERSAEVFITHLAPGEEDRIMAEIGGHLPERRPQRLRTGQVFEF